MGGDEFVVLVADAPSVTTLAERLDTVARTALEAVCRPVEAMTVATRPKSKVSWNGLKRSS